MTERLWTYPELKYVTVHKHKLDGASLAAEVNRKFHEGRPIRSIEEIERIKKGKTIFNKDQPL